MQGLVRALTRVRRPASTQGTRWASQLAEIRQRWNGRLVLAEEVEDALERGQPVVALESTIITHGMPHPTNLETARSVESIIRSHSATPATVALLDGKMHVGLSESQLSELADPSNHKGAVKASRRDLAPVLAMRKTGGTTVAGTMYVASQVGIDVFVTGGIGGVHRGAESSMDVSADLIELGQTPVAVVCAGAKSILDIARTLEVLETQGVCVATYGPTTDFPAFYHPRSGHKSPWNVDDPQTAAALIHTSLTLPLPLATLLAVPIPAEYTEKGAEVQQAVEQAVRESAEQGIDKRGKEVTPWLLKRVGELSAGLALDLNVRLIENNAHVGAKVAREVAILRRGPAVGPRSPLSSRPLNRRPYSSSARESPLPRPSVLVFGSAAIDITSSASGPIIPRTTTPGRIAITPGGVGRNMAEAAQRLLPSNSVQLVSAVGCTAPGEAAEPLQLVLLQEMDKAGLRTDGLIPKSGRTAACTLTIGPTNDLVTGIVDMGIVELLEGNTISSIIDEQRPKMVAFDCNLQISAIKAILLSCWRLGIPTFCDPTSIAKSARVMQALLAMPSAPAPKSRPYLTHLAPNDLELQAMLALIIDPAAVQSVGSDEIVNTGDLLDLTKPLFAHIEQVWVKCGSRGTFHLSLDSAGRPVARHLPAGSIEPTEIVSTTGAGDTLSGGIIAALVAEQGRLTQEWENRIMGQVVRTLKSTRAVG